MTENAETIEKFKIFPPRPYFQSESVAEYEQDVDEYLRLLERQLDCEMEKKLKLSNRIGVVQSQVTELWDRVDKARRRESDISYRVTAWAQHLAEQVNQVRFWNFSRN